MILKTTDIKGFEGLYTIDTFGNVYSLRKKKYLKPMIHNGYSYVYLTTQHGKWYNVNRLVLLSFGFKPGDMVIHIDGNKRNNYVGNLCFVNRIPEKARPPKKRPIIVYKDSKKKKYDSISEVSQSLGIYRKAIERGLLLGKPYKDYVFQYIGQTR
jgi:hypothetical protein